MQEMFLKHALNDLKNRAPQWCTANSERIRKGIEIARTQNISRTPDGLYRVTGHGKTYDVDPFAGICSCPDFCYRQKVCKHRVAVYLHVSTERYAAAFDAEWTRFLTETCSGEPRGLWDWQMGEWIHTCPDGFSNAAIFGVGDNAWCSRCGEEARSGQNTVA